MQKILKSEKGSVALFVLLSALFFLVVVTGVAVSFKNKEARIDSQIEKIKESYGKDVGLVYNEEIEENESLKDKNGTIIASTSETTPFLPNPTNNEILNNNLSTGLTIKDERENEWVWIIVPKSVTASATTDIQIENALRLYCNDVIGTEGDSNTSTYGFEDTWDINCILNQSEYNTTKSIMLNSIKKNGGFYIGKYETGINMYIPANATSIRGFRTESGNTSQLPAIKQNLQPYSNLTCGQAETLAKRFATGEKNANLLFGIQWDLILKHLKVTEGLDNYLLTINSESWGNYEDTVYNITNTDAWYSTDYGENWTKGPYNKTSQGEVLLTTGANVLFMKQNIYDLAGNVGEWTLEKSSLNNYTYRGGAYEEDEDNPASSRDHFLTGTRHYIGFRVSLY